MLTTRQLLEQAVVHHQAGRLDTAEQLYRQVLQVDSNNLDALNLLGTIQAQRGRFEWALPLLQQALRLRPNFPEAHNNLGTLYREMGKIDEALPCYQRALELDPNFADANNNLGSTLFEQSKRDAKTSPELAIRGYRRAIELNPNYFEAYNNLGVALQSIGKLDEAFAAYQRAIELSGGRFADAHNNVGGVWKAKGDLRQAIAAYRRAIELNPALAEAHNNLGVAQQMIGEVEAALAAYRQSLKLKPDYIDAHNNFAQALLLCGEWEEGFREYEWRWKSKSAAAHAKRRESPRHWDGSDLRGRRLLVYFEQGYGDILQFMRFAELLRARGATVLLEAPTSLHRLLKTCPWIDETVAPNSNPPCDWQVPLLSLPGLLGLRLDTQLSRGPYLFAEPELVARWRERLRELPGRKIGVAWQGNRQYCHDRWRSIPLVEFAPLAAVRDTRLVSLQVGEGAEQVTALNGRFDVAVFSDLDEPRGTFVEAAALMTALDLVVTSDTAIAHLAGALGVPVWLATTTACDWRWLRGREDAPWYASMRLFRQPRLDDWSSVFQRMAAYLDAGATVNYDVARD